MKRYSPHFTNKDEIWIYALLLIFSTLAALFVATNIKISPDSMRFGLISQEILSGNGIRVPIIRLEDNYIPVNGAIPFLDQMPLLPILFALLGGVTPQSYLPAQIINTISYVAISIFAFLIMKNIYGHKVIALITGLIVCTAFPLLRIAHYIWSEPLFISLIMGAVYFLTRSRNSKGIRYRRNLFIASICASAAILTRNAGIAIVSVFFWEFLVLVKNSRPERKYVSTILGIFLPVLTSASMFVRNYIISGTLRGFEQVSPERSFLDAFSGTMEMISMQFQLGKNALILIVIFVLLFVMFIFLNASLRKEILKKCNTGIDLVIIFIGSYTLLIVIVMAKQAWHFELRLVSPLVPFLFISSMFVISLVWRTIKLEGFPKLSLLGLILSVGIIAFGNSYKTYLNVPELYYKSVKSHFILHNCSYQWLRENYGENIIITSNKPFHLGFFGGYSTVALPHKRFDPNIHVPNDMESVLPNRMLKFGSNVIALFETAEERYDGRYVARLFNNRESDDKFALVYECAEGVVYALKE